MLKLTKFAWRVVDAQRVRSLKNDTNLSSTEDDSITANVQNLSEAKCCDVSLSAIFKNNITICQQGAHYIKTLFETVKVPVIMSAKQPSEAKHNSKYNIQNSRQPSLMKDGDADPFACVFKMYTYKCLKNNFSNIDITMVIPNNTADYAKLEYEPVPGLVETSHICQDKILERFIRFAYEHAKTNCRKKITFGHKCKELPLSEGMFVRIAKQLSCEYKNIKIELMDINDLVLNLVRNPSHFDLICTSERYGCFVVAVCNAVCGNDGVITHCDAGDQNFSPKPAQTNLSISDCRELSPYRIVLTCIDLLIELDNQECALKLWTQLVETMLIDGVKTEEFGGAYSCDYVICTIVNKLKCVEA